MVIYQTLYDLFPLASFDPKHVGPLAPAEFMQRVLVPEAAVSLIQEDSGQDRERAIETLRASTEYGVSMFPDLSGDAETAADKQMKDRLRAKVQAGSLMEVDEEDDVIACTEIGKSSSGGEKRPKPKPKPITKRPAPTKEANEKGLESSKRQETSAAQLDSEISMQDMTAGMSRQKGKTKASNAGGDDSPIDISDSAPDTDTGTRSQTKHASKSRKAYTGGSDHDRAVSTMPVKTPKARQRSQSVLDLASDSEAEVEEATPKPTVGRKQAVQAVLTRNGASTGLQTSSSQILSGASHPLKMARARDRKAAG